MSGKTNPVPGSNRGLLALVIIVCLISLAALLLTLLMLSGKIGSANEAHHSAPAKSLQKDPANIKALEENITSLRLDLVEKTKETETFRLSLHRLQEKVTHLDYACTESRTNNTQIKLEKLDSVLNQLKSTLNSTNNGLAELNSSQAKTDAGFIALRDDLNMTRRQLMMMSDTNTKNTIAAVNTILGLKLDNLDSALNQLKSAFNRTTNNLAELNNSQTKEKVIYHQIMTPTWIEAHASYINSYRLYTTEQLTFNASSVHNAALLKIPMIPEDALQNSTLLTVKIVVSNDVDIGSNGDNDIRYGVSDGISFVGFEAVDKGTYGYNYSPCFGVEGTSGSILTGIRNIAFSPRPSDSFYPGQFVITLKLNERWGSCYTAHDAGFVKTAVYNNRLVLSKGLTLDVYRDGKDEKAGIKFFEVTIIRDV